MYSRLAYIFDTADPADMESGLNWYNEAGKLAEDLATRYGFTVDVAATVISCLSPGCSWIQNVKDAESVLAAVANGSTDPEDVTCSTYGANVAKAYEIALTGDLSAIGQGLKTNSFAVNILGIQNDRAVTIDRHMLGAAVGSRTTLHQKLSVTNRRYFDISDAVKRLAKNRGVQPRQVQAVVWESYRRRIGLV